MSNNSKYDSLTHSVSYPKIKEDPEEKSEQVRTMREIYKLAKTVFIWFGLAEEDDGEAT